MKVGGGRKNLVTVALNKVTREVYAPQGEADKRECVCRAFPLANGPRLR